MPEPESSTDLSNAQLRDVVGRTIHGHACGCDHNPWPLTPNYEQMADAVLAALGLDRIEAMIGSMVTKLADEGFDINPYEDAMRVRFQAALLWAMRREAKRVP